MYLPSLALLPFCHSLAIRRDDSDSEKLGRVQREICVANFKHYSCTDIVSRHSTDTFTCDRQVSYTYDRVKLRNFSQMKHQLDATLFRFYFCRVPLHVSGASAYHQEYLKLVQRPLVHVLSLQVSHHISLLGPEMNAFFNKKFSVCSLL